LNPQPQHALVDGRAVKTMRVPQTAIVKGDARSYSIAAASVLAKVTRDRLMLEFHTQFPEYGFARTKATARRNIWRRLKNTARARFTGKVLRR
jgi:ribonuclease HII